MRRLPARETPGGWRGDRRRIEHEIVFQAVLTAVVNHVHAGIHGAIPDPRVVGDAGVPVLAGPDEIVGAGSQRVETFDDGGRIGTGKRDLEPARVGEGDHRADWVSDRFKPLERAR